MKKFLLLVLVIPTLIACGSGNEANTAKNSSTQSSTDSTPVVTVTAIFGNNTENNCDNEPQPNDQICISHSKMWQVINCPQKDKPELSYTKVEKIDKSATWTISFYEIFGKQFEINDGAMMVSRWSSDERYLYLIPSFCCTDDPQNYFFNHFQKGPALFQLDLKTGKYAAILKPSFESPFNGYTFEFSPNQKILASIDSSNLHEVEIQDIQTGKSSNISLNKPLAGGELVWSPDSTKLLLVATNDSWYLELKQRNIFTYILLDIQDLSQKKLFEMNTFYSPTWTTSETIKLSSMDINSDVTFNLTTNSFMPTITPTP